MSAKRGSGGNVREKAPAEPHEIDLFDPAFAACPHPVFDQLRERCPVARAAILGNPVISRYEDVIWALRHPEIFSSEMDPKMMGNERRMIPQQIDPPAQTRYRRILDPNFSQKRMSALEPEIRRSAHLLIDGFEEKGECDFNRDFAIPLPCSAFLKMMGLPLDDLGLFLELKDGIIRPHTRADDPEGQARVRAEASERIFAYFSEVIDERIRGPRDDLMSRLVNTEIDGQELSREELLDICFLLILAGLDTVTATLGCSVAYLAANPDMRRRIVNNPARIPNAVEELLRWETPVMLVPRIATQDVSVSGSEIRRDEMVMLLLGAANTDSGQFRDAGSVDFDRTHNRHLAFGGGPHRCLGSHLARLELRVALEVLHQRIPNYAIKPGETPRYSPAIREVQHLPLVWENEDDGYPDQVASGNAG